MGSVTTLPSLVILSLLLYVRPSAFEALLPLLGAVVAYSFRCFWLRESTCRLLILRRNSIVGPIGGFMTSRSESHKQSAASATFYGRVLYKHAYGSSPASHVGRSQ